MSEPTVSIADQIVEIAARHGLRVSRDAQSHLSVSRYLSITHEDGAGFDCGKAGRRRFVAETRMSFPRHMAFSVRISDHHNYGGPTDCQAGVRLDGDVSASLARIDAALALLVEIGA